MFQNNKPSEAKTPRRWWALGPVEALAEAEADALEANLEVDQLLGRDGLLTLAC